MLCQERSRYRRRRLDDEFDVSTTWWTVEPGQYTVEVTWSGDPVPQSPYSVIVFASEEELDSHVAATSLASTSDGSSSTVSRASSCLVQ